MRKFILTILLFPVVSISIAHLDSIQTTMLNGKKYVLHQIDPGETLYAISKKYTVKIEDIIVANPYIKNYTLSEGQIIKIPRSMSIIPVKIESISDSSDMNTIVHVVQKGQTLYSISRMNGVNLQTIRQWNKLTSDTIGLGQEIIVGWEGNGPENDLAMDQNVKEKVVEERTGLPEQEEAQTESIETVVTETEAETELEEEKVAHGIPVASASIEELEQEDISTEPEVVIVAVDSSQLKVTRYLEHLYYKQRLDSTYSEVKEKGIATWLQEPLSRKPYALHRYLPNGTIIKVMNLINGRMIYVKILGSIPDTGSNQKIDMILSHYAAKNLDVLDPRFLAEITYFKGTVESSQDARR